MSILSIDVNQPRWLRNIANVQTQATQAAMKDAREFLLAEARKNASKGGYSGLTVRTGDGYRSIRTYIKETAKGSELSLGANWYMKFHNAIDKDTGITILPKNGPYLIFKTPSGGFRRVKSVHLHQRPWATDALLKTRRVYPAYLRQHLERLTHD